jgi:3,4-dihydroxy 2-butanone 4-phosphate synthase/GTP cyclohydrolase II
MHALSIFDDVFAHDTERNGLLEGAMRAIGEEGCGVVVLLNRPAPGFATRAIAALDKDLPRPEDDMPPDQRDYGVGAQILAELGVHDMILLTNTRHSLVGLDGYDLSIVGERPISTE